MKCNIWNKEKIPLTDCLDFIVDNRGKTVPTTDNGIKLIATNCILNNSLYPVYEKIRYVSQDTYDNWFRAHPLPGDIIFVNKGTPGKVCLVPEKIDFCFAQDMMAFRVKKEIYNKYLFAILRSPKIQNQISNSTVGTLIPHFKKEQLKDIYVPVINYNLQKKIGDVYFKICQKIELNKKINNNLLELSKQLYMNTFSDNFDFEEIKLGELCNIKYGKGLPTTKILDNGYPVYGGNGIIGYYDSKMYDESQVLISCRGAASGKVILSKPNSFVTNNSLILEIDRLYHHYLKEYCFLNPFYAYTTGSAQPQITIDNIKDIIVKIPDSKTLEEFNCKCEAIEKKYFLNIEQNETLEQIRDTLLPKLMNGEIDLDNIEI